MPEDACFGITGQSLTQKSNLTMEVPLAWDSKQKPIGGTKFAKSQPPFYSVH